MKRILTALAVLVFACSAFATQQSDVKPESKPKTSKAPAVECSTVDDASLASNVKDKLSKTPSLKDATIEVTAQNGVVTLKGSLGKPQLKGVASNQARRVACVKKVDNQITVPKVSVAPKPAKNKNSN